MRLLLDMVAQVDVLDRQGLAAAAVVWRELVDRRHPRRVRRGEVQGHRQQHLSLKTQRYSEEPAAGAGAGQSPGVPQFTAAGGAVMEVRQLQRLVERLFLEGVEARPVHSRRRPL